MPSNKETLFQDHICQFLEAEHGYQSLDKDSLPNQGYHIIESVLLAFIKNTQADKFAELARDYGSDAEQKIIKALENPTGIRFGHALDTRARFNRNALNRVAEATKVDTILVTLLDKARAELATRKAEGRSY